MNRALSPGGAGVAGVRTVKLVRLRVGVFADGTTVGERPQPPRSVHVVDISADLDASEGVTAYCGADFASGALVEVPWTSMEPHNLCRLRSPISIPAGPSQSRRENGATTAVVVDDTHDDGLFRDSVVMVTAQWSVTNPIIYVNHAVDSESVDLAISAYDTSSIGGDAIARFELRSPLEVLTVGHNLISAGLSLAETIGIDLGQLKSSTPSTWWDRGQFPPDTTSDP